MKRFIPCIILLIFCVALARGEEERDLRREISLLNLVNGIYLTEEQLDQLIDLSRRADALREELRLSRETGKGEMLESFQRLREELVYGADVPDDVRKNAVYMNRAAREGRDRYKMRMYQLAREAEGVFTEGQKKTIQDFKPCLTPPRDLRNPERAGQTGDASHIEKLMSRLRDAPPERQARIKERALNRHIEKFSVHEAPCTGEEIEAERQRVSELIDRAMNASDVDFEMAKQELAREFKPNNDPPKRPLGRKIAGLFLGTESTRVLEDKLSGMRSSSVQASDGTAISSSIGR